MKVLVSGGTGFIGSALVRRLAEEGYIVHALVRSQKKAENILLEPFYNFKIKVNIDHLGRVMSDIEKAKGSFETPEINDERAVVKGQAPASTFMDYPVELRAFTGGKGMINLKFGGYDVCHNSEEIITASNYNKDNKMTNAESFELNDRLKLIINDNDEVLYAKVGDFTRKEIEGTIRTVSDDQIEISPPTEINREYVIQIFESIFFNSE